MTDQCTKTKLLKLEESLLIRLVSNLYAWLLFCFVPSLAYLAVGARKFLTAKQVEGSVSWLRETVPRFATEGDTQKYQRSSTF
jgi:hypothetical protein